MVSYLSLNAPHGFLIHLPPLSTHHHIHFKTFLLGFLNHTLGACTTINNQFHSPSLSSFHSTYSDGVVRRLNLDCPDFEESLSILLVQPLCRFLPTACMKETLIPQAVSEEEVGGGNEIWVICVCVVW